MLKLTGNTVRTDQANIHCASREQAEALFLTLKGREDRTEARTAQAPAGARHRRRTG